MTVESKIKCDFCFDEDVSPFCCFTTCGGNDDPRHGPPHVWESDVHICDSCVDGAAADLVRIREKQAEKNEANRRAKTKEAAS